METFSVLLGICAGNSPVTGEFPTQRPVTRSFDVFFLYLRLNKRLSKESRGWWFQTTLRPLWRHCNEPEWKGMIDYLINCSSPKKVAVRYVINIIELLQNISVTTFYEIKLWASIYININHKAVSVLYVTGFVFNTMVNKARLVTHIQVSYLISPWTRRPPFRSRYVRMHFGEWKVLFFIKISLEFVHLTMV